MLIVPVVLLIFFNLPKGTLLVITSIQIMLAAPYFYRFYVCNK